MWQTIKWSGRVTMWVMFMPIGFLLSYRHGNRKRHREVVAAMRTIKHSDSMPIKRG